MREIKLGYIPTDMREWIRAVTGRWDYIKRLDTIAGADNQKWVDNTRAANFKQLGMILDNPPILPGKLLWRKMMGVLNGWNIRNSRFRTSGKNGSTVRTRSTTSRGKQTKHLSSTAKRSA